MTVLPTAYLPPISWFAQLSSGEPVVIEQYEHFHKQTIRNRCTIDSPNGELNLTVPIDKSNFSIGAKCMMKDVRISYRERKLATSALECHSVLILKLPILRISSRRLPSYLSAALDLPHGFERGSHRKMLRTHRHSALNHPF